VFDFANAWSAKHDSIGPPEAFALNNADWEEFVQFAQEHEATDFESRTLEAWEQLEQLAREEQFYALDSSAFASFERILSPDVARDLNRFRDEITWALEEELVMRYHLQTGVITWSIPRDSTLKRAIELMQSGESQTILAGTAP
jgi:carboxyl-terminal processing protease